MRKYVRTITVMKKHDKKRGKSYEQYILTLPREVAEKLGKKVEIIDLGTFVIIHSAKLQLDIKVKMENDESN